MSESAAEKLVEESTPEVGTEDASFRKLPFSFAKRHGVVLRMDKENGLVACYRPGMLPQILAEVRRFTGRPFHLEELAEEPFNHALALVYQSGSSEAMQMVEGIGDDMDLSSLAENVPETEDLLEQEDDAPIIRLINAILSEAVKEDASDIHIETFEKTLVVRYRVDGVLREIVRPKRALAPLLISRIKVMAKMDIAEKRIPQDGRISLRLAGREVDIRVSTLPSNYGERVVMRLLDKQAGRLELTRLGMTDRDLNLMRELINTHHGIILVTGPTGSGKTTTLYSALQEIDYAARNILTVEDPIEYNLEGIGQTQVNNKVDMTFARGLRAMLRQDPDVVMVGEIRDLETAEIAVQASLTGHLVISTLHTNSAIGTVTRMRDMGVEPFLLASSLIGVLAQRLVRVLCPECKAPCQADKAEAAFLLKNSKRPPTIYHAVGCDSCKGLGYRGRMGIYELVGVDDEMRTLIHNNASEQEIELYARKIETPSIRADGRTKVLQGLTTVEEVLRVTRED